MTSEPVDPRRPGGGVHRGVVVIGAGIAGLTAAYSLVRERPGIEVLVLESSLVVGGKLALDEVAGVSIDVGAEALLNRSPAAVRLAREVGLADAVVHPTTTRAGIWTRGSVRPMPPTVMGIPADLDALAESGIVSLRGVLRARIERDLAGRVPALATTDLHDGEDVSVGSFVRRRLGREVLDRLVEPLLGGVYAGHADELSLRAAAPQIQALAGRGSSLVAEATAVRRAQSDTAPVFAGLVGGVGRLPQALARAAGLQVRTNATVRSLDRTSRGWRLVLGATNAEETIDAEAVVLATPATPAARLLSEAVPDAARELRRIDYASMAVVTLAFAAGRLREGWAGSGFLVPPVDGRTIKAATYSSSKWAWVAAAAGADTLLMRTSIGRHREELVLQRSDVELVDAATSDLADAIGLRGPLIDATVTRWGGALPQYAVGHRERVARIRRAIATAPGLEVCGAAYDGIGIAACVVDAQEAVRRLLAEEEPDRPDR
ncbi:MAG: protoporphyrinogen oxidase [Nocardioidaceae bacterium]